MAVMDDVIIAPGEKTVTPINFMEKEQQCLMKFCRDLVSCINKISRIDKNYEREAVPIKLSQNEGFQYSLL